MRPRPVVAITGPRRGGIARFFIALAVWLGGGVPKLFLSERERRNKNFDALIISGGDDLNHALYEKEFCDLEDVITSKRDALEYHLLHLAFRDKKPVFGICRGYQLINVYFGGTLDKDISTQYGRIRYSLLPWKKIGLKKDSFLHRTFARKKIHINTLHHQAVDKAASQFFVAATDEKGMIQAIEHKHHPLYGVQWHPEYLIWKSSQRRIFTNFIALAAQRLSASSSK